MAPYNDAQIEDMRKWLVRIRIGCETIGKYLGLDYPPVDLMKETTDDMKECCERLKDDIKKK